MKYIVIGFEGYVFSVAKHLQDEGCEVIVCQLESCKNISPLVQMKETSIKKKQRLLAYDNILKKKSETKLLETLSKLKKPSQYFVLCESNCLYDIAFKIQAMGFEGNFPTKEDRLFELDRNISKKFVEKYYPELKVAENKSFLKVKDGITFLAHSKKAWVLKSQTDDLPTEVPHIADPVLNNRQLIEILTTNKTAYEESGGYLLEQKIESLIEVTPEKIYYNGVPLGMTIMFENKHIGSGNLSYQVGCAGDLVFPVPMKGRIHDICFPKKVDEMAKERKGLFIWDASLLIDKKDGEIYFGEFCPNRLGFNSFLTTLEQMPSIHSYLETLVEKKDPYTIGTFGVSISLFNFLQDAETMEILKDVTMDLPEQYSTHYWPYDIYRKTHTGMYVTSGTDTAVCPVTATGISLTDAVNKLYTYVEHIQMNSMYYRPKFDWLSRDYESSILNRLEYCVKKKLFELPFEI